MAAAFAATLNMDSTVLSNDAIRVILEVTVTLSPFPKTSFANPLLYHEVYFLSFDFFFNYSV